MLPTPSDVLTPYLDFEPACAPSPDPFEAEAQAFHRANPHILRELVRVCLMVRRAGRTRWSIGAAYEVVRYNAEITTDHRTYKMNNNYRAFYARWIMRDVPELDDFFVTREQGRILQDHHR